jgi:antirestriction protein ArdC
MRRDIYQEITDQIVLALENGVRPWHQPWNAGHIEGRVALPLRHNGLAYRGVNVLALWMEALAKGYAAPVWMTFKQALALGANVRKGEKGSLVVYADNIIRTETDGKTGEESERAIPFIKGYTVFNAEQIDGLSDLYYAKPAPPTPSIQRIGRVEAFFSATGVIVRHGGNRAYYSVSTDHVQMPPIESFRDAEAYYARSAMKPRTGRSTPRFLTATLGGSVGATKVIRRRDRLRRTGVRR